jgi:predicted GNAT family acetyltransferase
VASPSLSLAIRHHAAEQRHEVLVNGQLSVVEHPLIDGVLVFTHTFVPPALRGRGIAEQLVRAALQWAQSQGKRISPQCSYVACFIQAHPEFSHLVQS